MTYARCSGVDAARPGSVGRLRRDRGRIGVQRDAPRRRSRADRARAALAASAAPRRARSASMKRQPLRADRPGRAARRRRPPSGRPAAPTTSSSERSRHSAHAHLRAHAQRRAGGAPAGSPARSAPRRSARSPSKTTATASGVRAACASNSSWMHALRADTRRPSRFHSTSTWRALRLAQQRQLREPHVRVRGDLLQHPLPGGRSIRSTVPRSNRSVL